MRLTFDRLWIVIAVALPAFVALLVPMPAVDLAYQVRAGDEILRTGALPATDTWTFTVAGTPWVDQQWLAQVVLAAVHALGGWELLAVLRAVLVSAVTGLMVATGVALGARTRTAAILALAGFLLGVMAMALRPQLLGMAVFALLLLLVAARRSHPRAFVLAPILVALWANLHGSFVLAPLLVGAAFLDDLRVGGPWRRSLVVLAAGAVATLVNPFGLGAWTYAAGIGANPAITRMVSEWQRTAAWRMPGVLFYPSLLVVVVLVARRLRGFISTMPGTFLLGVSLAALGAWTERGVAWWGLALPFLLAPVFASPGPAPEPVDASRLPDWAPLHPARARRASRVNGATAALLVALVIVALPWWRPEDPLAGRTGLLSYAPSELAAALRDIARPGDRVVAPQTWGSWLEWAVPDARYFIDSRFELYPAEAWNDHMALGTTRAGDVLDRWNVDILVMEPGSDVPDGWRALETTPDGAIYVRTP